MENRPVDLSTKSFEEKKSHFKTDACKNNEIISKRVDDFPGISTDHVTPEESCTVIEMLDRRKYSNLKNVVHSILRVTPGLTEEQM